MRAYVCDKCGKVVLVDDFSSLFDEGINHVSGSGLPGRNLDLCDTCVEELVAAVRTVKGEN